MKTKKNIIPILALVFASCGTETTVNESKSEPVAQIVEEVKAQSPHELELNDGEKWTVDKGMREAITDIEKYLSSHKSNKLVDYQLLGDAITVQTKKIISSCTMKGKGHDELHKWLLPFLELQEALVMASSPEEGAALVADLKEEIDNYSQFFN